MTVLSGLCLGRERWWHISRRKCGLEEEERKQNSGMGMLYSWPLFSTIMCHCSPHPTPAVVFLEGKLVSSIGTGSVSAQVWESWEDFGIFHYPLCSKPQYLICCHLPAMALIIWGLKKKNEPFHLILQKFWNSSCFIQHIFSFYRYQLMRFSPVYPQK